jgi:hypothetical protein
VTYRHETRDNGGTAASGSFCDPRACRAVALVPRYSAADHLCIVRRKNGGTPRRMSLGKTVKALRERRHSVRACWPKELAHPAVSRTDRERSSQEPVPQDAAKHRQGARSPRRDPDQIAATPTRPTSHSHGATPDAPDLTSSFQPLSSTRGQNAAATAIAGSYGIRGFLLTRLLNSSK